MPSFECLCMFLCVCVWREGEHHRWSLTHYNRKWCEKRTRVLSSSLYLKTIDPITIKWKRIILHTLRFNSDSHGCTQSLSLWYYSQSFIEEYFSIHSLKHSILLTTTIQLMHVIHIIIIIDRQVNRSNHSYHKICINEIFIRKSFQSDLAWLLLVKQMALLSFHFEFPSLGENCPNHLESSDGACRWHFEARYFDRKLNVCVCEHHHHKPNRCSSLWRWLLVFVTNRANLIVLCLRDSS